MTKREVFLVGDHAGPVDLVAIDGPHLTFRFVASGCAATYRGEVRPGPANSLLGWLAAPGCGQTAPPSTTLPVVAAAT